MLSTKPLEVNQFLLPPAPGSPRPSLACSTVLVSVSHLHMAFLLCLCVHFLLLIRTAFISDQEPTFHPCDSILTNYIFNDPISKLGWILRSWRLGLQCVFLWGGTQNSTHNKMTLRCLNFPSNFSLFIIAHMGFLSVPL